MNRKKMIYTIGHSTRSIDDFIDLLQFFGIETVVDIRTIPKSRFNPQYNKEALQRKLKENKIHYYHLEKLGGLRHPLKDSINIGWRNPSFRGFADYMQTNLFQEGIQELEKIGKEYQCVIMCSEAVPWRCHRSLISDALKIHKWEVLHILGKNQIQLHHLTSFLKVENGLLIYSNLNSS